MYVYIYPLEDKMLHFTILLKLFNMFQCFDDFLGTGRIPAKLS